MLYRTPPTPLLNGKGVVFVMHSYGKPWWQNKLTTHLFPYDISKDAKKLEKQAAEQMKAQMEKVIKTIQKHEIDPIGLGIYARAFEYKEFKKVEDNWGEAVKDADINVKLDLTIGAMGPVK